jgi:hypothetical protein
VGRDGGGERARDRRGVDHPAGRGAPVDDAQRHDTPDEGRDADRDRRREKRARDPRHKRQQRRHDGADDEHPRDEPPGERSLVDHGNAGQPSEEVHTPGDRPAGSKFTVGLPDK